MIDNSDGGRTGPGGKFFQMMRTIYVFFKLKDTKCFTFKRLSIS